MTCPYFSDFRVSGSPSQCCGVEAPFEPSAVDQARFCRSDRYRHCPLYRSAHDTVSLAIRQEVVRAVG